MASFREVSDALDALMGTPQQRLDAIRSHHDTAQDWLRHCMHEVDFDYAVAEMQFGEVGWPVMASWFAEPDVERARLWGYGATIGNPWMSAAIPTTGSTDPISGALLPNPPGYDQALTVCSNEVAALDLDHGTVQELTIQVRSSLEMALLPALQGNWFDEIRIEYSTCMETAGFTITGPGGVADAMAIVRGSADFNGDEIELERAIAVADATCRIPFSSRIGTAIEPYFRDWLKAEPGLLQSGLNAFAGKD